MKAILNRRFSAAGPSPILANTEVRAQRGDAEAQFQLGLKFASAKGAAQDYAQAEPWYLKAADQNHALAISISG